MTETSSRSIARSMLVNLAGILGSRVFGLARDILSAAFWGSTEVLQAAFTTAFAIPNTFRSLFAEGAFTAAFVPMMSQKLKDGQDEDAWKLACRTISLQAVILLGIIILVSIGSVITLCFLPATPEPTVTRRTFQILPLLIPYALFICVAGAFAAILNSLRKFAVPSLTPIIFNIVQIAALALLFLCGKTRHEFSSLIWFCLSTLLAGALQTVVLIIACRKNGFCFHFDPHWRDAEVFTLLKRIAPGLIGSGVQQLNILADKAIAVWLGAAAVGAINYSNRLIFLPVGIFGAAMGIACLPNMSRASQDEMADCLDGALRQVLFLSLPCTALLAALNTDIIRLIFQRGAFSEDAVRECAYALAWYLPGLPAFCAVKVAITTHHGRKDTTTPVRISLCCILLNFILNLTLCQFLRQGGLAFASAISSWVNLLALLVIDTRKLPNWNYRKTLLATIKLLLAAAAGGTAAAAVAHTLHQHLTLASNTLNALVVIIASSIPAAIVYLLACILLRQNELAVFIQSLRRRKHN